MDEMIVSGNDLPKEVSRPVALPVEMQRAFYASVAKMLRNPSLAYRKDKVLMKQMRSDPDCMAPLQQLQVSIAGLEWQVKPASSDDAFQEEIADRVSEVLSRLPRWADLCRHLLEAVWFGSSAANLIYTKRNGRVLVSDWLPFHPDTLVTNIDGKPGIRVGPKYYADMDGTGGETQQGFDSRVHLLTDLEMRAVVWHRYMVQGPDFDDPYETAYAYMGRGVRDVVWWYWNLKQAVLQNWATYAERYAQGIRVGYYPMANKEGKEQMEEILRNLVGDVSAVVPRATPGQKDYEIEILEPGAARAQVFADLTEWLAKNIKELIVGQSATSEAVSSGIGSNIGTQHQKTFTRQMKFVAEGLSETINASLVREIVDMNFGPQEEYPRFSFSVESPEMEKRLEAIRIFVNELGGTVSEAETRKTLGLAIPDVNEPVLTGKVRDVLPEFGNGDEPIDDEGPMLNSKGVFAQMSEKELRREALRRRRRGKKPAKNCGNGFGGFTDSNNCAGGPHDYPATRKTPTKKGKAKNAREVGEAVIHKHRVLVEEGYSDDQAWAIAYDMVAKSEHARPALADHAIDSKAHQDMVAELVSKGMSEEQAAQVVKRRMKGLNEKSDGFVPTDEMASNAKRGLDLREKYGKGGTAVGVARARDLANKKTLPIKTVRRMHSFFSRHDGNEAGGEDDAGYIAWLLWGGDAGRSWARKIVEKEDGDARDA